ncbi:MAG: hypothetical protein WB579_05540 [Bryobacteraceae bacterium]
MAQTLLVGPEIETGRRILQALDDAKLKISVAMWALFLREYGDWRLVISSRLLDTEDPREAYGIVFRALDRANMEVEKTEPLMILRMKDPFIRELRRSFREGEKVREGRSLAGTIGDRFLDHSYIYRVS